MSFRLKTRSDWFARTPHLPVPVLPGPVSYVFFNYMRKQYRQRKPSPGPRPSPKQIISELSYVQQGDMHKYADIRYNFMIGPDGYVYEGRGWISASTLPIQITNTTFHSLYIGYIGDYADMPPPKETFEARDELLKFGVQNKFIKKRFYSVTLQLPESYKCRWEEYVG